MWGTKIFGANIFMIHRVLPKFTKILSHENLEPYGIFSLKFKKKFETSSINSSILLLYLQRKLWFRSVNFVVAKISSSLMSVVFFHIVCSIKHHQTTILFMAVLFSK